MIFSDRKNVDNDFNEVVKTTLENLRYLSGRINSVSKKIENPNLLIATNCINSMRDEIQTVTVCGSTQTLHYS
ncbi:hypothetical protein [Rickettsiella endosymbiont of Aleochara curtula]|jgi:hypothetical protein|uniref:hypothetical protein n=1 Tax=Rickettsiella endosymbiont of Aleochara curtula TaxID=3077936 RepID=UPI00313CD47F